MPVCKLVRSCVTKRFECPVPDRRLPFKEFCVRHKGVRGSVTTSSTPEGSPLVRLGTLVTSDVTLEHVLDRRTAPSLRRRQGLLSDGIIVRLQLNPLQIEAVLTNFHDLGRCRDQLQD
jgi:hypothetical protein